MGEESDLHRHSSALRDLDKYTEANQNYEHKHQRTWPQCDVLIHCRDTLYSWLSPIIMFFQFGAHLVKNVVICPEGKMQAETQEGREVGHIVGLDG